MPAHPQPKTVPVTPLKRQSTSPSTSSSRRPSTSPTRSPSTNGAQRPSAQPAARGDFAETPLGHILAQLYQHGLTGSLVIDVPDVRRAGRLERICVHVDRGLICAASAGPEHRGLASLVVALCARTEGRFALYRDENLTGDGEGVLYGRFHPLALLTAAVRAHLREDASELVLSNLGESVLGLRPGVELRHYGFNLREQEFIRELNREPATLLRLIQRSQLPPEEVRRLVYLLSLTRAIGALPANTRQVSGPVRVPRTGAAPAIPGQQARQPVRPGRPVGGARVQGRYSIVNSERISASSVVPPPSRRLGHCGISEDELPGPPRLLAPALRQRWVSLLLEYRRMKTQDHFQLLGVDQDADERMIKAAYWQRIAAFQPERLPAELEPLHALMRDASTRLSIARHTLCDATLRKRYCDELASTRRARDPRKPAGVAGAAAEFEQATRLMKQRLYGTALEAARRAVAQDRNHPGYHALCGALVYLMATRDPDAQRDALHHLGLALRLDPECAMAHHYRGMFFKRAGDPERAMAHLQMAIRIAPENLEVARELRLLESRKRASSTSGMMQRIRTSLLPGRKAG